MRDSITGDDKMLCEECEEKQGSAVYCPVEIRKGYEIEVVLCDECYYHRRMA